jgi:quercetin dioxygenase-like cupin family protein
MSAKSVERPPMKIISLENVSQFPMKAEGARGVTKQIPIGREDGAPNFVFRVFTIEPGGETPFHTHDFEHVNYVIEGRGGLVSGDGQEWEIRAGEFALVLPGEKHQYRNWSEDEPFVMICAVPREYE